MARGRPDLGPISGDDRDGALTRLEADDVMGQEQFRPEPLGLGQGTAGRAGAHDEQIVERNLSVAAQPDLFGQLLRGRVLEDRAVRKDHHR